MRRTAIARVVSAATLGVVLVLAAPSTAWAAITVDPPVPTSNGTYPMAFTPDSTTAFVPVPDSNTVAVVDVATSAITGTIPVGTTPVFAAVSPDGTRLYVSNRDSNSVSVIDVATSTVVATIAVGSPRTIAFPPDGAKAYVASTTTNSVAVIDVGTATLGTPIAVQLAPVGIAINPQGTLAYVTNSGSETVSVVDLASGTVLETIPVGPTPLGITFTPTGREAWLSVNGGVSVIRASTRTVVATIPVAGANDVSISPDGTVAVVNNYFADTISSFYTATRLQYQAPVSVGNEPIYAGFVPDGSRAFAANDGGSFSVLHFSPAPAPAPQPPTVTVTATSGLQTTEAGGTAQIVVTLSEAPTDDVIIPLSTSDATEGSVPATVVVTAANWQTGATATVAGVDDPSMDGSIGYSIITGATQSDDPWMNGLAVGDVAVTNLDNDVTGALASSGATVGPAPWVALVAALVGVILLVARHIGVSRRFSPDSR